LVTSFRIAINNAEGRYKLRGRKNIGSKLEITVASSLFYLKI